jgi:hypothetical protein
MTDHRLNALRPEGIPGRPIVVAFVTGGTLEFLGITESDSTANLRIMSPVVVFS